MLFSTKIVMLAAIIGLAGCSYAYKEVYTPITNVSSVNTSGKITVYEIGEDVDRQHKTVGILKLQDSGLTIRCSYYDGLILAKQRARELGVDGIVIKDIERPSLASTCDRLVIEMIEFE